MNKSTTSATTIASTTKARRIAATAALAATLLAIGAQGETTYYTLNNSDNTQNAWGGGQFWTNEADGTQAPCAPNVYDAKGVNYIVEKGYGLRTRTGTCYGRITIGTLDNYGTIINKVYGNVVGYVSGLVCVNGSYDAAGKGSGANEDSRAFIGGNLTIASPESVPFLFGNNKNIGVTISANISGADGTKFRMGPALGADGRIQSENAAPMILSGDNSNYLGKIEVLSRNNATLALNSEYAIGGNRTSFATDTIMLTTEDTGTLVFTNNAPTKLDVANLGITFNGVARGSVNKRTFVLDVMDGLDIELAVPVVAYGRTSNDGNRLEVKKTGAGSLLWSGEITYPEGLSSGWPKLQIDGGRLILASSSTIALTNELSSAVWLKSPGASDTSLSRWKFSSGGALLFDATGGQTPGAFALDASAAIDNAALPIPIHLATDDPRAECDVCILKVPTSVRTLSSADFTDADAVAGNEGRFRISTANGVQTVRLVRGRNPTVISFR